MVSDELCRRGIRVVLGSGLRWGYGRLSFVLGLGLGCAVVVPPLLLSSLPPNFYPFYS